MTKGRDDEADRRRSEIELYRLALGVLGVWRVTHLLQAENGPWRVVVRLRRSSGSGFWGELLDCFQCLSLWTGGGFAWALGRDRRERVLLWPALSAGALILQRVLPQPAEYVEEGDHGVLWERTTTATPIEKDGPTS